ncbi:MAG: FAD-dependent oxidoreductase [Candidatus Devosia phytovorans]|uniref:FAD-dependent oxidoreductase n=1 Tax=Candidatus Devosia phytovorans TaxID=3121372 RepID=A0AAJ5VT92_9HYPH|nr:FAD-dependent oxidoreductase [Devosia sp.]WEK04391.1 MAG: FAD-dependent oxidoreductase [Devosia sp.]
MTHMVVVGAGECGTRAALSLREQGFDGDVTLLGSERHAPYERPPLSKGGMLAEIFAAKTIAAETRLAEAGIAFRPSTSVESIDRGDGRLALSGGQALAYDRLLLATGATPRRLPGVDGERVVYLRTLEDALYLREALRPGRHLIVIGGGFIGLEIAASARARGAEVTVVEAQPRLLARAVPEALAAILQQRHVQSGVRVMVGARIEGIESDDSSVRVALADGAVIEGDLLLVGIGAVPNVALAEQAGLAIENGIRVDERLATEDGRIFAAGDCCSFPLAVYNGRRVRLESWRNAQEQGSLAAANMLGGRDAHGSVPWFWSDQYELGLQIAGLGDEGASSVTRDLGDGAQILFHLAADGRLVAASGLGAGTAVAKDIRLSEMLIASAARPAVDALADPAVKLKSLLTR